MTPSARPLVLANMTVPDAAPLALIDAAEAGRFDAITLRIVAPTPAHGAPPVIGNPSLIRDIRLRLADTGVRVLDVGGIWLHPAFDAAAYLPALETAAGFGAKHFLMAGTDPLEQRVVDNLARFCELARPFGLKAVLEFIPYCETRSVADAIRVVSLAAQPNAGVLVDALHLNRSGGAPEQLRRYEPKWFAYCQLCDAPATPPPPEQLPGEARGGRLYPGQGALPLIELLDALPPDIPIGVEAPCAEFAHLPAAERGRLCGEATHAFLEAYRNRAAAAARMQPTPEA